MSSEAEGLRQELVVICVELLTTVREEIKGGADSKFNQQNFAKRD